MISTPISSTISGTLDIQLTSDSGLYFTNIYFGEAPIPTVEHILLGGSDVFNSVEFQAGATFSGGSLVLGSSTPSGVLQVVDLENLVILSSYEVPILEDDNVEDFS